MIRNLANLLMRKLFGGTHHSMSDVVEQETHKAVDETKRLADALEDLSHRPDPFATLVNNMRGSSFRSRATKGRL